MGRLFDFVERHRAAREPYPPSYARIAEQVGVSRQTLLNWREPTKLPNLEHLKAFADEMGVPYLRVLDAALVDIGYLDAGEATPEPPPPASRGRKSS